MQNKHSEYVVVKVLIDEFFALHKKRFEFQNSKPFAELESGSVTARI